MVSARVTHESLHALWASRRRPPAPVNSLCTMLARLLAQQQTIQRPCQPTVTSPPYPRLYQHLLPSRNLPASLPSSRRSTAHATSACTRHSCRLRISMHTSKVGGLCSDRMQP